MVDSEWVNKSYRKFYNKYGYIPEFFDVYNSIEIKDVCCTISTRSNGAMGSGTVLVIEDPVCVAMRGRYDENGKIHQQFEPRFDGITNTLTTVTKDNLIIESF